MDASVSGVTTQSREWTSQFSLINNLSNEATGGFLDQLICCEPASSVSRNRAADESQSPDDDLQSAQSEQANQDESTGQTDEVSASQEDESNDVEDLEDVSPDPNVVTNQIPVLTVATVVQETPIKATDQLDTDNVEITANQIKVTEAVTVDRVQASTAVESEGVEQALASKTAGEISEDANLNGEQSTVQEPIVATNSDLQAQSTLSNGGDESIRTLVEENVVSNSPKSETNESVEVDDPSTAIAPSATIGNASDSKQSNSSETQSTPGSRERSTRRGRWFERDASARENGAVGTSGSAQRSPDSSKAESSEKLVSKSTSTAATASPSELTFPPIAEVSAQQPSVDVASGVAVSSVVVASPAIASGADVLEIGVTQGSGSNEGTIGSTTPVDANRPTSRAEANNAASNANTNANVNDPTNLSQMERVRLVQRVSRSFSRLGPTGGEINLKLHPPQLGSLNVQVRLEGRSLTAKLTTESVAAQEVLVENLPVLRSRLAEQGFEISQFQVDVADTGNMNSTFGSDQGKSNDFQQSRDDLDRTVAMRRIHSDRRAALAIAPIALESQSTSWRTEQGSGIDVRA